MAIIRGRNNLGDTDFAGRVTFELVSPRRVAGFLLARLPYVDFIVHAVTLDHDFAVAREAGAGHSGYLRVETLCLPMKVSFGRGGKRAAVEPFKHGATP